MAPIAVVIAILEAIKQIASAMERTAIFLTTEQGQKVVEKALADQARFEAFVASVGREIKSGLSKAFDCK
jgi:hypothetical protein